MRKILILLRSKWIAWALLIGMSMLFCLPGSALPKQSWLDGLHVDKWVHAGFFFVLVLAWSAAFRLPPWAVYGGAFLYGAAVEIVQHQWIAHRSFDAWDLAADTLGIILGGLAWLRVKRLA